MRSRFGKTKVALLTAALVAPLQLLGMPNALAAYAEGFDTVAPPALPAGWAATTAVDCVGSDPWATLAANPDSAPNIAFVNDPGCIADERLDSALLTVSVAGPGTLSFRHFFNLESTFDGGVLEVSRNGGAFVDFLAAGGTSFAVGGYNGIISVNFGSPIGGRQAWTGNSGGYITTTLNFDGTWTGGTTATLRFRRGSDNSFATPGWNVDTLSSAMFSLAPVAVADNYNTNEDVPLVTTAATGVLANDTGGTPPYTAALDATCPGAGVANGTLNVFNADGSFTYTPNLDFFGVDDFGYRITDSTPTAGGCGLVTITVAAVADPPVANDDLVNQVIDTTPSVTVNVLANDTDPDSDLQANGTVTVTVPPSDGGTAVVNPDKTITFTPTGNVIGNVTFTYQVCDDTLPVPLCDTAVVTVDITTSAGDCTITGGAGGDQLQNPGTNDVICGGAGNDIIQAGGGNDVIIGGTGNDRIQGGVGNDTMIGGAGNDTLQGGSGFDTAHGGDGTDSCTTNEVQTSCP